jgi:hypothetical protein
MGNRRRSVRRAYCFWVSRVSTQAFTSHLQLRSYRKALLRAHPPRALLLGLAGTAALSVALLAFIVRTPAAVGTSGYSGDGGPATAAELNYPVGVAVDSSGNVYIADGCFDATGNNIDAAADAKRCIRKITASTGVITTIAGDGTGGYSGDGGPATSAELDGGGAVAVDSSGNVYIADTGNHVIRKVTAATGIITTIAGDGTLGYAGGGTIGYSGDGGPATSAEFNTPEGVAVDSFGNVYVTDYCGAAVREIAASTGSQFGQSMIAGDIYTIAGTKTETIGGGLEGDVGPATSAELDDLAGVAADSSGNVYISQGERIREVATTTGTQFGQSMIAGDIYTIAGDGVAGSSGDGGGPATSAELPGNSGVAVDAAGNVYTDGGNNDVLRVTVATGDITTVASGSGDGWQFSDAVAVGASGNVYIADYPIAGYGGSSGILEATFPLLAPTPATAAPWTPAPQITHLTLSHTSFRHGTSIAHFSRVAPVGTTISFALSEKSSITLGFTRVTKGRFSRGLCVPTTPSRRRLQACTRLVAVAGTMSFASLKAGTRHISFDGILSNRSSLSPGTYRLTLVAQNAAGQSASAGSSFILKR